MLEAIRGAISFLRHRQILHKLGVAVSITVIGIACYVLYHMLRGIDVDEVVEAIKQTEARQIALAALFVGSAAPISPTASMRLRPSPLIRSGTMSAPASSPAGRCDTASIPPGA